MNKKEENTVTNSTLSNFIYLSTLGTMFFQIKTYLANFTHAEHNEYDMNTT